MINKYLFGFLLLSALFLQVFDWDMGKGDDFLGRLKLSLIQLKETSGSQSWFPLKDADKGKLCLEIQWLRLAAVNTEDEGRDKVGSAVLQVFVDSCKNLPSNKVGRAPSSILELQVRRHTSKIKFSSPLLRQVYIGK